MPELGQAQAFNTRRQRIQNQIQKLQGQRQRSNKWVNPAVKAAKLGPEKDLAYNTTIQSGQRNLNDTLANTGQQRYATQQAYGLDAGFDANNPYSRAALMKSAYDQAQRGAYNSYAAQGQLYSGASGRAHAHNQSGYLQQLDAARKAQTADLQELDAKELAAKRGFGDLRNEAYVDLIERRLKDPLDPSLMGGNPYKKPRFYTQRIHDLKKKLTPRVDRAQPHPQTRNPQQGLGRARRHR